MRGLDETGRLARCFTPRVITAIALAAVLTFALLLPGKEHLSAWTDNLSTTVSTSINSAYGYLGWVPWATAFDSDSESASDLTSEDKPDVQMDTRPLPCMMFNTSLPTCKRTLLFPFKDMPVGFTGLVGVMIRVATIAEALGYTFLFDDDDWIYGRWTDYFEPYSPDCIPADDWQDQDKRIVATHKNEEEWKQANHVVGLTSANYIDKILLTLVMPKEELDNLHLKDIAEYPPQTPLPSSMTVPSCYVDMFQTQVAWLHKFWQLSPLLDKMVKEEKVSLGWDMPGWDDRARTEPKDVVIGLHIRLGDKCSETHSMKAGPLRFAKSLLGHETKKQMAGEHCNSDGKVDLDDAAAQIWFNAAAAEVNAILADHAGQGIPDPPNFDTSTWTSKPTLLVMSDDNNIQQLLSDHNSSAPFRILHTQNAQIEALENGFPGRRFVDLPLEDRIASAQPLVRDLELLSKHAGGLVIMAISNVGRALALLGGAQNIEKGRLMAIDGRWYPTDFFN